MDHLVVHPHHAHLVRDIRAIHKIDNSSDHEPLEAKLSISKDLEEEKEEEDDYDDGYNKET